jgi:hypothetical protein
MKISAPRAYWAISDLMWKVPTNAIRISAGVPAHNTGNGLQAPFYSPKIIVLRISYFELSPRISNFLPIPTAVVFMARPNTSPLPNISCDLANRLAVT